MNCRLRMADCRLAGLHIGALLMLWPVAAFAQLSAPRERAQIEYGPVSLYPSLQVVDAGQDANVFDDNSNPQSDFTFTIASRALVVTRLGANELMFSTGSDYVWFKEFKQERSSNALYAMRFNFSASRFKPYIGASHMRTRARQVAEIETRARRLERNVVVGSNLDLTERTAIAVSASASDSTYATGETFRGVNLSDSLDRKERSYSGGVKYAITPLTSLLVQGTYSVSLFPGHLRDAKAYTFAPLVEFSPDASIRGRFAAGIQRFKPDDPSLKEFTGLTYSGGVNWTLWNRTGFELQAQRNISYSYRDLEPYYLLTTARVAISQKFIGPIDLSAGVERQFLSYRFRRGQVAGVDFDPNEAARNLMSAGVGITLGGGFKMVISGERTVRKAPFDPLGSFTRTRLLSTVTVGS
jgi:hypothetical protein